MSAKTDWAVIEQDWRDTGLSYPALARKHGVSLSTLKKVAARECWAAGEDGEAVRALRRSRRQVLRQLEPVPDLEPVPLDTIGTGSCADPDALVLPTETREERYWRLTDEMARRIEDALAVVNVESPSAIKMLASALKDLRELQGFGRTALDREEQKARIAKLRSEVRIVEHEEEQGGLIFLPSAAEAPTPPED